MPNYEHSLNSKKTNGARNAFGYDKIYANLKANYDDKSVLARQSRFNVIIKDAEAFHDNLITSNDLDYSNTAGTDLSNLFVPFQSIVAPPTGEMPGFAGGVETTWALASGSPPKLMDLLPFRWEPAQTGYIYDTFAAPSGDGLKDLVSAETYYGDPHQYRDLSDVRGIGLRLPLMAIGWGFTSDDASPWPSGERPLGSPSGAKYFKGSIDRGWQVDPCDYVAAPVDFRYDKARNVWTCGSTIDPSGTSFWAKITGNTEIVPSGNRWRYAWTEHQRNPSGWISTTNGRVGTTSLVDNPPTYALNSIEAFNSATGIQGNSIDHSDSGYPSGFRLLPVRGNPVVKMWPEKDTITDVWYYSFSVENSEDGNCGSGV